MGFIVTDNKVSLITDTEINKIQGHMPIKIGGIYFDKIGVLWDTGATLCVVDEGLFSKLHVGKTESISITTGGGTKFNKTFNADIQIAGVFLEDILFAVNHDLRIDQGLDLVIGMNVIQKGKMIVDCTGITKFFEFTFSNGIKG